MFANESRLWKSQIEGTWKFGLFLDYLLNSAMPIDNHVLSLWSVWNGLYSDNSNVFKNGLICNEPVLQGSTVVSELFQNYHSYYHNILTAKRWAKAD